MVTSAVPQLHVLPREECLRLLRGSRTGWLVFSTALRPRMVLVNLVVSDGEVLVRTGPGDAVTAAENGAVVILGVSSTDDDARTGWSVTVTGTSRLLGPVVVPADGAPQPWAPGLKDHVLAVPLEDVTGRRLRAGTAPGAGEAAWGWWG